MLGQITAGLFFLLLIWGNLVAGMQAGMACPDWPLCQGELLPPLRLDVWMEFMHRLIAAVATVFLLFLCRKRITSYHGAHKVVPMAAVGLIAGQIVLGGVAVLLRLPVPVTTLHFMIGLAMFLLVLYMATYDGESTPPLFSLSGYAGLLFSLTALIFSQASLGAYLRHSASGLACSDFPTCQGMWLPPLWDKGILVNFAHRVFALGLFLSAAVITVASFVDQRLKEKRADSLALLALLVLQIGIGAAVLKTHLSYPVTALHLAVALLIIRYGLRLWFSQMKQPGYVSK